MPITFFNQGDKVRVISLKGNDEIRKHLSNLGITKGREMIVQRFDGNNYIFLVDGNRLALSKRIIVEEVVGWNL